MGLSLESFHGKTVSLSLNSRSTLEQSTGERWRSRSLIREIDVERDSNVLFGKTSPFLVLLRGQPTFVFELGSVGVDGGRDLK